MSRSGDSSESIARRFERERRRLLAELDGSQDWYSYDEVAAYLRVSRRTIERRVAAGELRAAPLGRSRRIHRSWIADYVARTLVCLLLLLVGLVVACQTSESVGDLAARVGCPCDLRDSRPSSHHGRARGPTHRTLVLRSDSIDRAF